MEYFFHVVLCEVSACFIGCFLSLLISYNVFHYRFDTKETTLEQTKKLLAVYVLCIPLTALFLYILNHYFLPTEVMDKRIPVSRAKKNDIKATLSALQHD